MTNPQESKPKRSLARKIARTIIPGGVFDYVLSEDYRKDSHNLQLVKILAGATYLAATLVYGVATTINREPNPLKWRQVVAEENRKTQEAERKEYSELNEKLFGTNALADVNGNGTIEPNEYILAWQRMGILPTSSRESLERAVRIYESERGWVELK